MEQSKIFNQYNLKWKRTQIHNRDENSGTIQKVVFENLISTIYQSFKDLLCL
jgi:hypothetical protein